MAGTPAGYSALPAIALLQAWLEKASGHAINAATQSEADLQLRYIAQVREQRLPTLATSRCCEGPLR